MNRSGHPSAGAATRSEGGEEKKKSSNTWMWTQMRGGTKEEKYQNSELFTFRTFFEKLERH